MSSPTPTSSTAASAACTNTIFTTDISSNPLNLHYTLAYPESAGIKDYSLSLGSFDPTQLSAQKILLENRRNLINSFPTKDLSPDNQLTQQILSLYYETQLLPANQYLLDETLSPSLGTQAAFPFFSPNTPSAKKTMSKTT